MFALLLPVARDIAWSHGSADRRAMETSRETDDPRPTPGFHGAPPAFTTEPLHSADFGVAHVR